MSSIFFSPRKYCKSLLAKEIFTGLDENKKSKRNFKCSFCSHSYSEKFALSQHIRNIHKEEAPFKCDLCPYTAAIKTELTNHLDNHGIYTKTYPCHYCEEAFSTRGKRTTHENIHIGKPFGCKQCVKSFPSKGALKVHAQSHNRLACPLCHKTFRNAETLRGHKHTHSKNNNVIKYSRALNFTKICNLCNEGVTCLQDLKNHVLKTHLKLLGVKNVFDVLKWNSAGECPVCGKVIKCVAGHFPHLFAHLGILPFKCHLCQYQSRWLVNLKSHFSIHNQDQSLTCKYCQKVFKNKSQLTYHITRKHEDYTNHKVYLCELCGKMYLSAALLKKHKQKKHNPNVGLFCLNCKCIFETNDLDILKKQNKNQKKQICLMCKKAFLQEQTLTENAILRHKLPNLYSGKPKYDISTHTTAKDKNSSSIHVCLLLEKGSVIEQGFISQHLKSYPSMYFQCDVCQYTFSTPKSIDKHIFSHCMELSNNSCENYVPAYGNESKNLINFIIDDCEKSDHSSYEIFQTFLCECSVCGKKFLSALELIEHERTHCDFINILTNAKETPCINSEKGQNLEQKGLLCNNSRVSLSDSSFKQIKYSLSQNHLQSKLDDYNSNIVSTVSVPKTNGGKNSNFVRLDCFKKLNELKSKPSSHFLSETDLVDGSISDLKHEAKASNILTSLDLICTMKEYLLNTMAGKRKIQEKIAYESGKKKIVTEDFGLIKQL